MTAGKVPAVTPAVRLTTAIRISPGPLKVTLAGSGKVDQVVPLTASTAWLSSEPLKVAPLAGLPSVLVQVDVHHFADVDAAGAARGSRTSCPPDGGTGSCQRRA